MALLKKNSGPDAGDIRKKYEDSNRSLQREQWNFILNRAMVNGEQWVNFDRICQTVAAIPRDPDRIRCTFNRLWPATRHLMAKLLSRPLIFEVPPSEPDDASIRGAHVAEAVLEDIKKYHNLEGIRESAAWSAWLGGTSVLAVDWDQNYGKTIGYREDGSEVGAGEVCVTALNLLEVGWEPGTVDAEKAGWWIRAQALPPSQVQEMFDLKDKPKADASAAQGHLGRTLSIENLGRVRPELTIVLTYYEKPCKKNPDGVVCTVVGDKIVDGPHKWPFPFKDRLNMVVVRETKVAGRAHGETVLSAAVPVQVAFNQAWSNIIEHLKLTGNARLLVPDAALDGVEELTDLPGEVLNYNNAGGKPEWMTPAPLGSWVIQSPKMLSEQIDDILGLHDVSRGISPANVESGVGISILVEQDSTPLGALTRELTYGFERLACMILETYAENVTDTRKARIRQKGQSPEIVEWNGASLAGQTNAMIPMDAVMPRSRTAMMAMAKELWDRKIVQDPQMFTKIADLPDQDDLLDAIDTDAAKAQRENRDMAVGRVCVPADFDQHETHIRKHNMFRKTLRYESLPEEMRQMVDQHVQAHATLAAEAMGTQVNKANIHPALAATPTAAENAPLPPGMVPGGAEGGMAPGMLPGPTSNRPVEQAVTNSPGMPPPGMAPMSPEQLAPVSE